MDENPYRAPEAMGPVVGVRSGSRDDLRKIAAYQKGILTCILITILGVVFNLALLGTRTALPPAAALVYSLAMLAVGLASSVFVVLLAIRVYNVWLGIVLGLLALLPCFGLIVLLVINSKATRILQANGHRVGLLGADLSRF